MFTQKVVFACHGLVNEVVVSDWLPLYRRQKPYRSFICSKSWLQHGPENLENGKTFFQSGKGQGILNRLEKEKSENFAQNNGKIREFYQKNGKVR